MRILRHLPARGQSSGNHNNNSDTMEPTSNLTGQGNAQPGLVGNDNPIDVTGASSGDGGKQVGQSGLNGCGGNLSGTGGNPSDSDGNSGGGGGNQSGTSGNPVSLQGTLEEQRLLGQS